MRCRFAAVVFVAGMGALAVAGPLFGARLSRASASGLAVPCEAGTLMADVVQTTLNSLDVDVTGTRVWAYDRTVVERYRIWQTSPGVFCVLRYYSGTFETVSGTSPAGRAALSGGVTGSFVGADRLTLTGTFDAGPRPTQGVLATIDRQCRVSDTDRTRFVCPGATGNVPLGSFFFSSRSAATLQATYSLYRGGAHGNWAQLGGASIGDIIG